jgi:sensor histidine kinase regulating citrate/malate metabolism
MSDDLGTAPAAAAPESEKEAKISLVRALIDNALESMRVEYDRQEAEFLRMSSREQMDCELKHWHAIFDQERTS